MRIESNNTNNASDLSVPVLVNYGGRTTTLNVSSFDVARGTTQRKLSVVFVAMQRCYDLPPYTKVNYFRVMHTRLLRVTSKYNHPERCSETNI